MVSKYGKSPPTGVSLLGRYALERSYWGEWRYILSEPSSHLAVSRAQVRTLVSCGCGRDQSAEVRKQLQVSERQNNSHIILSKSLGFIYRESMDITFICCTFLIDLKLRDNS